MAEHNRDGRAWVVCDYGLLAFQCLDGNEQTTPPHEKLRCALQWEPEGLLVGGGAILDKVGKVQLTWKSGTFQFGEVLKTLANEEDKANAMNIRDLIDLGVPLSQASVEIEQAMQAQWERSATEWVVAPVSKEALGELQAAAKKMRDKFEICFPNVSALEPYKCAIDSCKQGGSANFQKKGAASALTASQLHELLSKLPDACAVGELDFCFQLELMKTREAGRAMGDLLSKCPRVRVVHLHTVGMTADALKALAVAMPEGHEVIGINISGNEDLLVGLDGIYALLALVAKTSALQRIQFAGCGVTSGKETELKQRLREVRPGLKFLAIAPLAR